MLDDTQMARQQLTEIQDRHNDLIKLEASITEVRDMFMEVAALVQEQGEMVSIFQLPSAGRSLILPLPRWTTSR